MVVALVAPGSVYTSCPTACEQIAAFTPKADGITHAELSSYVWPFIAPTHGFVLTT